QLINTNGSWHVN
nr:Chain a, Epitope peptide [Hepacivirus hominis]4WHT_c Chain c, Epitope peptide [Hepacivirus hominis]4WHT_e Chain e, Epitope peptide [Hepacivirus hominis]4WHT_g Chain g, Epitope peptide [Hepacivirus hominis]4WHT_i Chain i, Epitope peptide [Hepacivirus hominis]4WHT_k Chain k, Epitope peptide [Hepacivirus hominis]4WHT_m Chain m, Epitope peptide [Hepacivirus hominis]4WHT_o Chain o, Epitope peptide [Hepacivirus hominis]4WHT_q Chain q, Epitope peptide [Hepacivirus hominis]4WHT_s Chain s, Epito